MNSRRSLVAKSSSISSGKGAITAERRSCFSFWRKKRPKARQKIRDTLISSQIRLTSDFGVELIAEANVGQVVQTADQLALAAQNDAMEKIKALADFKALFNTIEPQYKNYVQSKLTEQKNVLLGNQKAAANASLDAEIVAFRFKLEDLKAEARSAHRLEEEAEMMLENQRVDAFAEIKAAWKVRQDRILEEAATKAAVAAAAAKNVVQWKTDAERRNHEYSLQRAHAAEVAKQEATVAAQIEEIKTTTRAGARANDVAYIAEIGAVKAELEYAAQNFAAVQQKIAAARSDAIKAAEEECRMTREIELKKAAEAAAAARAIAEKTAADKAAELESKRVGLRVDAAVAAATEDMAMASNAAKEETAATIELLRRSHLDELTKATKAAASLAEAAAKSQMKRKALSAARALAEAKSKASQRTIMAEEAKAAAQAAATESAAQAADAAATARTNAESEASRKLELAHARYAAAKKTLEAEHRQTLANITKLQEDNAARLEAEKAAKAKAEEEARARVEAGATEAKAAAKRDAIAKASAAAKAAAGGMDTVRTPTAQIQPHAAPPAKNTNLIQPRIRTALQGCRRKAFVKAHAFAIKNLGDEAKSMLGPLIVSSSLESPASRCEDAEPSPLVRLLASKALYYELQYRKREEELVGGGGANEGSSENNEDMQLEIGLEDEINNAVGHK